MKKFYFLIAGLAILSSCDKQQKETLIKDQELAASRDSLQSVLADQDSLLMLMTEISDGMNRIKSLENILAASGDLNRETSDRREQIRADIVAIQQELAARRERLSELEARLNKSNSNNEQLKKAIETLKGQIADQESTISSLRQDLASANIHIDELAQDIDSLNTKVATTLEEKKEVEKQNENLTNELNLCFYAIGSSKELKEHNILKTGFLRKTKIMPDDFERSYFTPADKRTFNNIATHSRKAKIITNQPATSYEFVKGNDDQLTLHILNPSQFWATTNYVVIQID